MKVRVRATYSLVDPDDTDGADVAEHGFTDPRNPWGGLDAPMPDDVYGDLAARWIEENAETVTFDSAWEAAEFAEEFPGGVWDHHECADESLTRDGMYRTVTLHVLDHEATVFELMAIFAKRLVS